MGRERLFGIRGVIIFRFGGKDFFTGIALHCTDRASPCCSQATVLPLGTVTLGSCLVKL